MTRAEEAVEKLWATFEADGSVGPILADALEEAGQGHLAAVLRTWCRQGKGPAPIPQMGEGFYWVSEVCRGQPWYLPELYHPALVEHHLMEWMHGGEENLRDQQLQGRPAVKGYASRRRAWTELALALEWGGMWG